MSGPWRPPLLPEQDTNLVTYSLLSLVLVAAVLAAMAEGLII